MTIEPGDVPKYQVLAGLLRRQILSGEIAPSQPVPSKRVLIERHGVSTGTVDRAMDVLKAEGLIRTVKGLGLFPVRPENRPASS